MNPIIKTKVKSDKYITTKISEMLDNPLILQNFIDVCISFKPDDEASVITSDTLKNDFSNLYEYFKDNIESDYKHPQNHKFNNTSLSCGFLISSEIMINIEGLDKKHIDRAAKTVKRNKDFENILKSANSTIPGLRWLFGSDFTHEELTHYLNGHTQNNIVIGMKTNTTRSSIASPGPPPGDVGIPSDLFNIFPIIRTVDSGRYDIDNYKRIARDDNLIFIRLYFLIRLIYFNPKSKLTTLNIKNINNILFATLCQYLIIEKTFFATISKQPTTAYMSAKEAKERKGDTYAEYSYVDKNFLLTNNNTFFDTHTDPVTKKNRTIIESKNNLLFSILPDNMGVEDKLRLYFVIANFDYICYSIIKEVETKFPRDKYIFTADLKPVFEIEIDQPLYNYPLDELE